MYEGGALSTAAIMALMVSARKISAVRRMLFAALHLGGPMTLYFARDDRRKLEYGIKYNGLLYLYAT